MKNKEFYISAGASFAQKLNTMSGSKANSRTKDTLEVAYEDRKKKIPEEFLQDYIDGFTKVFDPTIVAR